MSELMECKLGDVIKFGNGKSRPDSVGINPVYGLVDPLVKTIIC